MENQFKYLFMSGRVSVATANRDISEKPVRSGKKVQVLIALSFFVLTLLTAIHASAQEAVLSNAGSAQYAAINLPKGYTVAPFSDTLFKLYTRAGSFSPQDRAAAITKRIQKLGEDYYFSRDSLQVLTEEKVIDIVYGENIVMSISDEDALMAGTDKQKLAEEYKKKIADTVVTYKDATSFQSMFRQASLVLLVLAIIVFSLFLIVKLFGLIKRKIEEHKGKRIKGIKLRNYTLLKAEEHAKFLIGLSRLVKFIIIFLLLFLAFPLLFGIFPATEKFAGVLTGFVKVPVISVLQGIWNYLPRLATIAIIITIAHYFLRGIKFLKKEIEEGALKLPGFHISWADLTYQVIRVLIYILVLVMIFPYLPGAGSPVFNGVTIFLGALFTFGSSASLGNVVSGLALTYMRSFNNGDRVKIGDVTGDIVEKNLLVTRVRTIKNEVISIPNSNVLNNHTINFSKDAPDRGLILHTTITMGYDGPWQTVHKLAIKAALATKFIESEPAPFVYQTSLDDFYVSYQINAYTKYPNRQSSTYSELFQHILDLFHEAGIEMLSPHYHALRDGHMMAVPAGNLPQGYAVPSLRMEHAGKSVNNRSY